jgi:hypothetical protein
MQRQRQIAHLRGLRPTLIHRQRITILSEPGQMIPT